MSDHLHHKFEVLRQNLMHGKLPRDLPWDDAVGLISHLGTVEAGGGDEFTFSIAKTHAPFKRPHSRQMELEDISKLRKLLHAAESADPVRGKSTSRQLIVVVDHHSAHIFAETGGSRPSALDTIEPADPHHYHHHLVHKKEAHYQGDRVPEDTAFYGAIADSLKEASEIVIIGHGVGKSSAASFLMEYLKSHRPDTAKLVKAQEVADLSALTEPQIEQLAERHMKAGR